MEETKYVELEFAISKEEEENYLKFKQDVIECIEKIKHDKTQYVRYYREEVQPQLLALKTLKEAYPDDELIQKYATTKLENADSNGWSEEKYEKEVERLTNLEERFERVLEEYFTERVQDGIAIPNEKALNYCEIARLLSVKDE